MAYVVFALYFIYTLGQVLNVKWTPIDPTSSLVIIATWEAGFSRIAGFLNACLVFSLVSSSTACLYIASRTLNRLANDILGSSVASRILYILGGGEVAGQTGVPVFAVFVSFLMNLYVPLILRIPASEKQDVSRLQGLITD
jgi:amino acid transporter